MAHGLENSIFTRQAEQWISQVKDQWRNIPEFQVEPSKFCHLAVICDGNRRAARERQLDPWVGHRVGVEAIKGIMEAGRKWGIKHLIFWTWSTENWKRDEGQVDFVMNLAAKYLQDEEALNELKKNQVRFTHLGRKDRVPTSVRLAIEELEAETVGYDQLYVNLALDYGGLDEAARAIEKMTQLVQEGVLAKSEITINPGLILGFLDTGNQPVPDLVIRTGMSQKEIPRTSGFMPLQTLYSGWKFITELFPDLTPEILLKNIKDMLDYDRRMGK
ncbi:di-trans,poly-cis-decaprenylcistransferase [Candidatus Amesbacteria bacterium]|nr:di-trans,poly-cis-decaprenylcistransferase [Candidatus Amesbacteria bacterium]